MKRKCDNCGKEYVADERNLRRGWGLCCSKSCAAKKREIAKPGYNPITVSFNNSRRKNWNGEDYGDGRDELGNFEGIGQLPEFNNDYN